MNTGQLIAQESAEARAEANEFGRSHEPHSGETPEALAFQIAQTMFCEWPPDVALDQTACALVNDWARNLALTVRLHDVADS